MSIRLGENIVAGRSSYQPSLFDFKWADHILNDIQWVRADNFPWQYKTSYENAYNHLVADIADKEAQSETIEGIIITYYLASDGHKICTPDQLDFLIQLYDKCGICWYYVLDTAKQRFKLPRTKWGFEGIKDGSEAGKYIKPGLPNITGHLLFDYGGASTGPYALSGAFQGNTTKIGRPNNYDTNIALGDVFFNAANSNTIYGSSQVVQEQATQMYLYFYIGGFSQTALENTAGLSAELFNEKVDRDLSNINTMPIADVVVDFQAPTATNNYTWYRKYASGWVEQGGNYDAGSYSSNIYANITYPIEMANTRYTKLFGKEKDSDSSWEGYLNYTNPTTTGVTFRYWNNGGSSVRYISWQISGMAA